MPLIEFIVVGTASAIIGTVLSKARKNKEKGKNKNKKGKPYMGGPYPDDLKGNVSTRRR